MDTCRIAWYPSVGKFFAAYARLEMPPEHPVDTTGGFFERPTIQPLQKKQPAACSWHESFLRIPADDPYTAEYCPRRHILPPFPACWFSANRILFILSTIRRSNLNRYSNQVLPFALKASIMNRASSTETDNILYYFIYFDDHTGRVSK